MVAPEVPFDHHLPREQEVVGAYHQVKLLAEFSPRRLLRTTRPHLRAVVVRAAQPPSQPGVGAAYARLEHEKGWPAEGRDRPANLLASVGAPPGALRSLAAHGVRGAALAEMLGEGGASGRTAISDPDEMGVRVVALMMGEGMAPLGRRPRLEGGRGMDVTEGPRWRQEVYRVAATGSGLLLATQVLVNTKKLKYRICS